MLKKGSMGGKKKAVGKTRQTSSKFDIGTHLQQPPCDSGVGRCFPFPWTPTLINVRMYSYVIHKPILNKVFYKVEHYKQFIMHLLLKEPTLAKTSRKHGWPILRFKNTIQTTGKNCPEVVAILKYYHIAPIWGISWVVFPLEFQFQIRLKLQRKSNLFICFSSPWAVLFWPNSQHGPYNSLGLASFFGEEKQQKLGIPWSLAYFLAYTVGLSLACRACTMLIYIRSAEGKMASFGNSRRFSWQLSSVFLSFFPSSGLYICCIVRAV